MLYLSHTWIHCLLDSTKVGEVNRDKELFKKNYMCISISSTYSNKMTAYSFLVLIVLCATNARARADSNALSNEITEIIKNTMKCRNNPALAVSVVKDGSVVYSRGFGSRDLDHQANVTRSTVFGVASLSKAFAATLILKLLEENSKYDFFLY